MVTVDSVIGQMARDENVLRAFSWFVGDDKSESFRMHAQDTADNFFFSARQCQLVFLNLNFSRADEIGEDVGACVDELVGNMQALKQFSLEQWLVALS